MKTNQYLNEMEEDYHFIKEQQIEEDPVVIKLTHKYYVALDRYDTEKLIKAEEECWNKYDVTNGEWIDELKKRRIEICNIKFKFKQHTYDSTSSYWRSEDYKYEIRVSDHWSSSTGYKIKEVKYCKWIGCKWMPLYGRNKNIKYDVNGFVAGMSYNG